MQGIDQCVAGTQNKGSAITGPNRFDDDFRDSLFKVGIVGGRDVPWDFGSSYLTTERSQGSFFFWKMAPIMLGSSPRLPGVPMAVVCMFSGKNDARMHSLE